MKQIPTRTPSTSKFLGYSSMAAAFLAIGHEADAQVVYTDVDPDSVLTSEIFEVDFDGDAVTDVIILHTGGSSATLNAAVAVVPAGNAVIASLMSSYMYPQVLGTGDPIGPEQNNFQTLYYGTLAYQGAGAFGNWDGQAGFMGCRFVGGDGQTHYGWVELSVATGSTSATVLAYGYESTPDMGINAGDGIVSGIADAGNPTFNVTIAPNPTRDHALIELPSAGSGAINISLLNSTGQRLFSENLGNIGRYDLDLTSYTKGVYFVRLQNGNKVAFKKVVKD